MGLRKCMVDDQSSRFKSTEAIFVTKNWGTKMMDSNMTKYQSNLAGRGRRASSCIHTI